MMTPMVVGALVVTLQLKAAMVLFLNILKVTVVKAIQ
jgi:hypothetical protein